MCWRDCCCYTNEQKIAWARKNGVAPPAYVLAAIQEPACCQRKVASCCSAKRSCCEKKASAETSVVLTWRKRTEAGKRRLVSIALLQALRCQGLSSSWTLLPPTVMPTLIQLEDAPAGLTEQVMIVDSFHLGQLPPPELPPPQNDA